VDLNHPSLRALDSALSSVVTAKPVAVSGEWSTSSRRTYRSEAQLSSGVGPFIEVEDRKWNGILSYEEAIGGMGLLVTPSGIYWGKGPIIAHALPASVSLHTYAAFKPEGATFGAGVAGTGLPAVPVPVHGPLVEACRLKPDGLSTGRVEVLAQVGAVTFAILILPRAVLKMGRNHLWRVRDQVASQLPTMMRDLLTRRRGGSLSADELSRAT
jgi:hypothetical protein